MNNMEFCERWFFAKNMPIKPMTLATAKRKHGDRSPYCAVLGGFENPTHVITVAGKWVSVNFFDDFRRAYLNYDFEEVEDGRLFLMMAIFREYDGETTEIVHSISFSYSTNGNLYMLDDERGGDQVESEAVVDTQPNWAEFPKFGEFDAVCELNRVGGAEPG